MARSRFKSAKKAPVYAPPVSSRWTAGDRIGKMTASVLRDHRVSTLCGREVDPDLFIEIVETLEEILIAAGEAESAPDNMTVDELPDAVREIEKERRELEKDQNAQDARHDQRYDDLVAEQATADEEHEQELREAHLEIDGLRRKLELTEHALCEAGGEGLRVPFHGLHPESECGARGCK